MCKNDSVCENVLVGIPHHRLCYVGVITHVYKSAMCVLASKRVRLCVHAYVHSHAQYMYM